jgi:acetolactate decarboxylase
VIRVLYEDPVTGWPKPRALDAVPILARDLDGQVPTMPQGIDLRPASSSARASVEPRRRVAPGRQGRAPVATPDREEIAETVSDEESTRPSKEFRATAIPAEMVSRAILPFICLNLLFLSSCTPAEAVLPASSPGRITQVSVINALMIGRYDGVMSIPELLRYGDFGLGTLDHLDGEMIVLDGRVYQVRGDGVVVEAGSDRSTPFAIVTRFKQDGEFPCPRVYGLTDLDARLNKALRQDNNFLVVRVDGRFSSITLRSVYRQEPPYRPLGEVAKGQSVWTHKEVSGTLVGVRCPGWVEGLSVPGYHWHFLSDDRKVGGHVLDCRVREGRVHHQVCRDWLIKLDGSPEFNGANLREDLSLDLRRVERSRGEESQDAVPGR